MKGLPANAFLPARTPLSATTHPAGAAAGQLTITFALRRVLARGKLGGPLRAR